MVWSPCLVHIQFELLHQILLVGFSRALSGLTGSWLGISACVLFMGLLHGCDPAAVAIRVRHAESTVWQIHQHCPLCACNIVALRVRASSKLS